MNTLAPGDRGGHVRLMQLHHSGHALPGRDDAACDDAWAVRERRGTVVAALADGVGASREGGRDVLSRSAEKITPWCARLAGKTSLRMRVMGSIILHSYLECTRNRGGCNGQSGETTRKAA